MHSSRYCTESGASLDQICLLHLLFGQHQQIGKKVSCENFLMVPAIHFHRGIYLAQKVQKTAREGVAVAEGGNSVQTHPGRMTGVSGAAGVVWGCREYRP